MGGVRIGGHGFHPGFRRGFRQGGGLLQYGVVTSGGAAVADNPPVNVNITNQLPRDGFDRPLQRVCRSETHTVPSESGGTRDVTVTRCLRE